MRGVKAGPESCVPCAPCALPCVHACEQLGGREAPDRARRAQARSAGAASPLSDLFIALADFLSGAAAASSSSAHACLSAAQPLAMAAWAPPAAAEGGHPARLDHEHGTHPGRGTCRDPAPQLGVQPGDGACPAVYPSLAVAHAARLAAAAAAALPRCWATLREPALRRLARGAGLLLAPGPGAAAGAAPPAATAAWPPQGAQPRCTHHPALQAPLCARMRWRSCVHGPVCVELSA